MFQPCSLWCFCFFVVFCLFAVNRHENKKHGIASKYVICMHKWFCEMMSYTHLSSVFCFFFCFSETYKDPLTYSSQYSQLFLLCLRQLPWYQSFICTILWNKTMKWILRYYTCIFGILSQETDSSTRTLRNKPNHVWW